MNRTVLLLLVLCGAVIGPALGQGPVNGAAASQSAAVAARLEGRAAASEHPIRGYFIAGFVGGLTVGFTAPVALFVPDSWLPIVTAAGVGTVAGAAIHGARRNTALPPALGEQIQDQPTGYQQVFRDSYAERLQDRRLGASLWGGLAGAGIGFGVLLLLASGANF